jgi:folylpolyglutamate synthase
MLDTKIHSLSHELETPPIPKYPGFLSLLAVYIFISEKVDVAILETGIGGETDSTNIFPHPVATGITTIGIDHVNVLGDTVEKIAWHKAGIFKSGSVAGTVVQDEAVLNVLRKRAEERHVAGGLQVITDQRVLDYRIKVDPDMRYQRSNAALAIFLADTYLKSAHPQFSLTAEIARSLQDVELLGRSQVVEDRDNTWFLSSGVNEISLKEAVSWFKTVNRPGSVHSFRQFCFLLTVIHRPTVAPQVLMFNQNFSSAWDPYLMLKLIHEALCAGSPVTLQGVIFCTNQMDEIGKEKSGMSPHTRLLQS